MERDYFISRAGVDKHIGVAIADVIRDAGYTTFLQDEDFGHASFMARMAQGFSSGARMIALLSMAYQKSEYCKKEYEHILVGDPRNLNERLIVLRIEDVAPIEHLKDLAFTDLVPVLNDASELAHVVRARLAWKYAHPNTRILLHHGRFSIRQLSLCLGLPGGRMS
jgi:hypothetical protein